MGLDLVLSDAKQYRFYAQLRCNAHFQMCRIYHRRHNWVGIPAVILGTIVGTTIFSGLAKEAQLVTGLLAITAVVLSSLQTFFNFPATSAHHKQAAVKFESVRHELDNLIRTLLITPPQGEEIKEVLKTLHDITARMNQVSQEAPSIRASVYAKAKEALKNDPLLDVSAANAMPASGGAGAPVTDPVTVKLVQSSK